MSATPTAKRHTLRVTKGHGTGNDFVLFADPDGQVDLTPDLVRALADRRFGLGGDGVIRAIRTSALLAVEPVWGQAFPDVVATEWFMDYRNADGSTAQMCGNGIRVFAAFLAAEGVIDRTAVTVGTRAGARGIAWEQNRIVVGMGRARWQNQGTTVAWPGTAAQPATQVWVGTPHTVVQVDRDALAAADLTSPPVVAPNPPQGTNVELVAVDAPGRLAMRVFERGVGETLSCGTGACAAAVAAQLWGDVATSWKVATPGGTLAVEFDGPEVRLAGPAVLVARAEVDLAALNHGG